MRFPPPVQKKPTDTSAIVETQPSRGSNGKAGAQVVKATGADWQESTGIPGARNHKSSGKASVKVGSPEPAAQHFADSPVVTKINNGLTKEFTGSDSLNLAHEPGRLREFFALCATELVDLSRPLPE